MQNHFTSITIQSEETYIRVQEGLSPFTEKPSDKHGNDDSETNANDAANCRIKADELFYLFTADIIRKEVLFTR
ncbi:MAG: hypothetical protein ABIO76_01975 [Ginsengibacter sp.]